MMKKSIKYKYLVKLIFLMGLFLTCHAADAQSKMKNFSGTWVLNADKSDFGRGTVANASQTMTLTIKQLDNSIIIASGDSTERIEDLVKLDGTSSVRISNKVISGIPNIIKIPLTVQVINEGSFIVTLTDQWLRVRTYSISADLQTLTMNFKIPDKELNGKLVYDRKKSN